MKVLKLIGFGVIIWAVGFAIASVFLAFKSSQVVLDIFTTIAVVATAFFLARSLNITSTIGMLPYSAAWVLIGLILDYFVTTRFAGPEYFKSLSIWLGYAIIFIAPFLAVKKQKAAA